LVKESVGKARLFLEREREERKKESRWREREKFQLAKRRRNPIGAATEIFRKKGNPRSRAEATGRERAIRNRNAELSGAYI